MYLYDRGWKPWEVDTLSLREASDIDDCLQKGLYGPIASLQQTYHQLSYQHAALGTKDKFTPFWRMFSDQYEAFIGEKYVAPKQDLFKQVLLFAESSRAITNKHQQELEGMRDG